MLKIIRLRLVSVALMTFVACPPYSPVSFAADGFTVGVLQMDVNERAVLDRPSPIPPPVPDRLMAENTQSEDSSNRPPDEEVTERGVLSDLSKSSLISNIKISPPYGSCFKQFPNLRDGELVYYDRNDVYSSPPPLISGATFIRPCIGAPEEATGGIPRYALIPATTNPFLSFLVGEQVTVYVALPREVSKPAWMSTFVDTGVLVSLRNGNSLYRPYLKIFGRNYPAGSVVLGGNGATRTAQGIYAVMVKPGWNTRFPTPAISPFTR
jgi:hypothetical protein